MLSTFKTLTSTGNYEWKCLKYNEKKAYKHKERLCNHHSNLVLNNEQDSRLAKLQTREEINI